MNCYKYDIHVHTSEVSHCGKVPAKDMVKLYWDSGYHGVVITDHYYKDYFESLSGKWSEKVEQYLRGYYAAKNEGIKLGLQVIPGMEITFPENWNDYLVYGIDEKFLLENKELYKLGLKGFRKLLTGCGALLVQAHPYRPHMVPAKPELLDGVEVYNGNPRHDSQNHLAEEFALQNGLLMLSGSDFHQQQDLARGGIVVSEGISTAKELSTAIAGRKVTELIKS